MAREITKELIKELHSFIEQEDTAQSLKLLNDLHPADIAEIYDHLKIEDAKFLYLLLDGEKAADVLAELEDDDRDRFLSSLSNEVIAQQFIQHMDTDDAADVLGEMTNEEQREILSFVTDTEQALDIADLLNYDENSAGGLMAKELIAVNEGATTRECLKEIAAQAEDVDEIYYVYVVDENRRLKGNISLKKLLLSHTSTKIETLYNRDVISVSLNTNSEEVAHVMDKYDLVALPVVDHLNRLMGRITIDDVVDVIKEEADKDYQMLSGLSQDVVSTDGAWLLTKARLPWLLVGLMGGLLGSQVIAMHEADLAKHASMAFFIPLIAGMGGNVGVQSSSIVVQGLASQSIDVQSTFQKIVKEFSVALINGLCCSLIVLVYNLTFSDDLHLTITVSAALLIVILFASVFGTFIPLALNRFKIDPALATGPFITTINDILGLFIYLLIGSIVYGSFTF